MSDIVISGYHGFANSGDEALLWAILNTLKQRAPSLSVTVLSKTPEETARDYGVKSVSRYNYFQIKSEMKHAKMLIFGGGSLLQDVTSSKSLKYYLMIIALAQHCGIKTMLYANGIGPITTKTDRKLTAKILNKVDIITLRDDKSDEELKNLGVTKPEIIITADPAFTINVDETLTGQYFIKRAGVPDGTKVCAVSIRSWKNSAGDFSAVMAKLCDYMVEKYGIYPLFVPMQYPLDMDIAKEVMAQMKNEAYLINRNLTVAEMFSVLSGAEVLIGMRLHSLIYATTLEIPAMALVYDPKISAFMESLSQPYMVDVENITYESARKTFDTLMQGLSEHKEKLHSANALLKRKAEENAEYAIKLLNEAKKI